MLSECINGFSICFMFFSIFGCPSQNRSKRRAVEPSIRLVFEFGRSKARFYRFWGAPKCHRKSADFSTRPNINQMHEEISPKRPSGRFSLICLPFLDPFLKRFGNFMYDLSKCSYFPWFSAAPGPPHVMQKHPWSDCLSHLGWSTHTFRRLFVRCRNLFQFVELHFRIDHEHFRTNMFFDVVQQPIPNEPHKP